MNKVNRWEAPEGFVAIENVGNWSSCDGCKAIEEPYGECVFHSTEQALCHGNYRKDQKVVTLREANKHHFIHTGRDECPKWVSRLAGEHPEWRFYCWYTDGSADNDTNREFSDCIYTLRYAEDTDWYSVTHFQIIPT